MRDKVQEFLNALYSIIAGIPPLVVQMFSYQQLLVGSDMGTLWRIKIYHQDSPDISLSSLDIVLSFGNLNLQLKTVKKEDRPLFVKVLTLPLAIVAVVFAIGGCSHHATTASITSETTAVIPKEQPKPEIIAEVKSYDAEWASCEKSFVHNSKIKDCQLNIAVKSFDPSKKSRAAWIAEDLPDIISKYQLFLLAYIPPTADQEQRRAEEIAEKNQHNTDSLACEKSFNYEAEIEICKEIALRKFSAASEKSRTAWIAKDLPEIRSTPEQLARGSGNYADLARDTRNLERLNIQIEIGNKLDKLTEARYSADPTLAPIPTPTPTPVATSNSIDVDSQSSKWAKTVLTAPDPFSDLVLPSSGQSKKK